MMVSNEEPADLLRGTASARDQPKPKCMMLKCPDTSNLEGPGLRWEVIVPGRRVLEENQNHSGTGGNVFYPRQAKK